MTEHERFSRAFLTAIGGMDCTDRGSAPPEGTPGVWLPRSAWLSIMEGMVRGHMVLVVPTASEH